MKKIIISALSLLAAATGAVAQNMVAMTWCSGISIAQVETTLANGQRSVFLLAGNYKASVHSNMV